MGDWYTNIMDGLTDTYSGDGYSASGDYDWWSAIGGNDYSGDSGGGGFWGNLLGGIFGGGSSGGGSSGGGMNWGSLFASGVSGAAGAAMNEKTAKEKGKQDRQTSAFEAELLDYYKQKDKSRRRVALDTYGQFDLTKRWAPNMTAAPAVDVPNKPTPKD